MDRFKDISPILVGLDRTYPLSVEATKVCRYLIEKTHEYASVIEKDGQPSPKLAEEVGIYYSEIKNITDAMVKDFELSMEKALNNTKKYIQNLLLDVLSNPSTAKAKTALIDLDSHVKSTEVNPEYELIHEQIDLLYFFQESIDEVLTRSHENHDINADSNYLTYFLDHFSDSVEMDEACIEICRKTKDISELTEEEKNILANKPPEVFVANKNTSEEYTI